MSITNAGFSALSSKTGGVAVVADFSALAYGTGSTGFAASQTALVTETARAAATATQVTTTVTNDTLNLAYTFTIGGTLTIAECGVFNNATSGGTMLARSLVSPTRSVVSGDSWALTYKIKFA